RVFVCCLAIDKRDSLGQMVTLGGSAYYNNNDTTDDIVLTKLYPHARVNERNAPVVQSLYDRSLGCAMIDADKYEGHTLQLLYARFVQKAIVRNDVLSHPRVLGRKVRNLLRLASQLIERGRPRASESIVIQENVSVEEMDLLYGGLGDQVEDVR